MVQRFGVPLVLAGLLAVGCTSGGGGSANDNETAIDNGGGTLPGLIEVPDPHSGDNPTYPLVPADAPASGEGVRDDRFGTTQTRVVQTEGIRHEYARHDPFNDDQSMILLIDLRNGEWRVYRTESVPYDQESNLVTTVLQEEPRWDPQDVDVLWGTQDFRIMTVNMSTGQTQTVKDFTQDPIVGPILTAHPELYRITMKDEGESSADKRFWAFFLQGNDQVEYRQRFILTWDRQEDRVLGTYEMAEDESRIDWIGMSVLGTWVVLGGDGDNAGHIGPGLVIANRELTEFHSLYPTAAHGDVGLDTQGREVFVQQNVSEDTIDLIPLEVGAERTLLLRLYYDTESPIGLNSGVHISCNYAGYAVVSTTIEPGLPEQNWLDRSIALVTLDRTDPRVFYLAKVYGTTSAYWEETHAAITHDGRRVIWATNWGLDPGEERVWCMELTLP